jgi:CheY-like chemotaxis protein
VADRAFLGQLLVQALSIAVQSAGSGRVGISIAPADEGVQVILALRGPETGLAARVENLRRLAQAEGIGCRLEAGGVADTRLTLTLPDLRPVRVLIVEDNPGAIELYRRYLVGSGYQLQAVTDPRLALEEVVARQPHVVVLDVMMPHLDGWSVLRSLKADPRTASVPVVLCTVVEDPALASALGAAAWLPKPVSRAELLTALHRCLPQQAPR